MKPEMPTDANPPDGEDQSHLAWGGPKTGGKRGSQDQVSPETRVHLQHINAALVALKATGEDGFEGLVGVALRELTGMPFRLAKSGSQRGIDGKFDQNQICFETKRYSDKIQRSELLTKIADLARGNEEPDMVWVLGATVPVSTQDADDLRVDGRRSGITVLILDWSEIQLPKLAVLMAAGGARVGEFLERNLSTSDQLNAVLEGLRAIRSASDFEAEARNIKAELETPSMTAVIAKNANEVWLTKTFSSSSEARIRLGQPLSPAGDVAVKILPRTSLVAQIQPFLTGQPDGRIAFILGNEGCGKSWIVAQSWLELERKTLMVVIGAEIFRTESSGDLQSLLIRKLIEQTGDSDSDQNRRFWEMRFARWANFPAPAQPRLIVMIDGINQRPEIEWHRTIEGMGRLVATVGGRLIVTSRTHFFTTMVKHRLLSRLIDISADEWTIEERDEILRDRGIDPKSLHGSVGQTLRNPRILGIAVELFSGEKVLSFHELSVSRLLFEHIRDGSEASSASHFVRKLQKHAHEILSRLEEKRTDDLTLFESDIPAVADGRFFTEVEGEPGCYQLNDHGLTLALGFSVLAHLRQAKRNLRNVDESLATLLEPIAALDSTFDVLLAALTVACVDEQQQDSQLISTLVKGFTSLQNPDQARFPEFTGLARSNPTGFLGALRWLALQGGRQPNFDWVSEAIRANRTNVPTWNTIAREITNWLSTCSLEIKLEEIKRIHPPTEDAAELEQRTEEKQNAINLAISSLSSCEQAILERLNPVKDGNISTLSSLAIEMLVGMPLSPFADALLNWSFSQSLHSNIETPYEEFRDLVSFNTLDWVETRDALNAAACDLRADGVSETGKWALVNILRSTGDMMDAAESETLVEELTKDRERFPSRWRLIETYCATDPCDPDSPEPENIAATAIKYSEIDVDQIRTGRWTGGEDHFFRGAKPGVVRFRLDVAISKQREIAAQIADRSGESMEQGLFDLAENASILTEIEIAKLKAKWNSLNFDQSKDREDDDDFWIYSQQLLLAIFPHLGGTERVHLLLGIPDTRRILADLIDLIDPIDPEEFDHLLRAAREDNDERRQYLLLLVAEGMANDLTDYSTEWVELMAISEVDQLRVSALGVISRSHNLSLTRAVASSDWNAFSCRSRNTFEAWRGSVVLLQAWRNKIIDARELITRIDPSFYRVAVAALPSEGIRQIAERVDLSIRRIASKHTRIAEPPIEIETKYDRGDSPACFSLHEPEPPNLELGQQLNYLSKQQDCKARNKRCADAFIAFKNELTATGSGIVLEDWDLESFSILVANASDHAEEWFSLFMDAADETIPELHNLMVLLAAALSESNPEQAGALRQKASRRRPFVRISYGETDLDLEMLAIWHGVDTPAINRERFRRLDHAESDHRLSVEVLAALVHNKQELLNQYIVDRTSRPEPAKIARGLMVAGFSDDNSFATEVFSRYKGAKGFVGKALDAALYSYERNKWARVWFARMCSSDSHEIFWQSGILLRKIVDGRFSVWNRMFERNGEVIQRFQNEPERGIANRYRRWTNHRKDKLFGRKIPSHSIIASLNLHEAE